MEYDSTETDSKNYLGNEKTMQSRLRRARSMDEILNFVLINEHLYYDSYCAPYNRTCYNMCINWDRSIILVVITHLYKIFHQYCFTFKNTFCYKTEYSFVAKPFCFSIYVVHVHNIHNIQTFYLLMYFQWVHA
jgi:hypothetical protein